MPDFDSLGSNARFARAIIKHLDKLPEGYAWEPSLVGNIKAATLVLERIAQEKGNGQSHA